MKNLVVTKDEKWIWPANDVNSWIGQKAFLDLRQQIEPYLKGNTVMIQAGGNCGLTVDTFVEIFDTIYTFEPEPVNFYCLTQNVDSPKVIKMQACLGEANRPMGVQPLVAHVVDIGGFHIAQSPGVIPMFAIDSLNLQNCDLLQLDIEGYEYRALQGAVETIKKFKPVICVEIVDEYLIRYNNTQGEVLQLLEELNYEYKASYGSDRIYAPK
jgi:FkbM family methyltransferase